MDCMTRRLKELKLASPNKTSCSYHLAKYFLLPKDPVGEGELLYYTRRDTSKPHLKWGVTGVMVVKQLTNVFFLQK